MKDITDNNQTFSFHFPRLLDDNSIQVVFDGMKQHVGNTDVKQPLAEYPGTTHYPGTIPSHNISVTSKLTPKKTEFSYLNIGLYKEQFRI